MVTNYHEVTVRQFKEYTDLIKKYDRDNIDELTALDLQVKTIALFTEKTEDEVYNLPIEKTRSMVADLSFLRQQVEPAKTRKKYRIGGFVLTFADEVKNWTTAQFVDFQSTLKSEDLSGTLACVLIPKGKKYADGYDVEAVKEAIADKLPIDEAFGVSAFFFGKFLNSLNSILSSLERQVVMDLPDWKTRMDFIQQTNKAKSLIKNGAGYQTSTRSAK